MQQHGSRRAGRDAPTQGAGPLGLSGTATNVSTGAATGLAPLADDDYGSGPRMPMMPSTWSSDSPDGKDE
jgi:PPE-repeat protein